MKDVLFQQLAASIKEGGAILRGKKKPARSTTLQWLDAKSVREKLASARFSSPRSSASTPAPSRTGNKATAVPKEPPALFFVSRNPTRKRCLRRCIGEVCESDY